jgi:hypothetical protein
LTLWGILFHFLTKWSLKLRKTPNDEKLRKNLKSLSAGGLVLYGFTVSFSSIDWVMSLESQWYSTIFGMLYAVAQSLSAFALVLFLLPYSRKEISKKAMNDLGNILLALIMLWAYLSFVQYLIIWSGNIPEEASWFNHRSHSGWQYVITFIACLQFLGPFILLLFKDLKTNIKVMSRVGFALVIIRGADVFWFIAPTFHSDRFSVNAFDLGLIATIGIVWVFSLRRNLYVQA